MTAPAIDVVMAVRDGAGFIAAAIGSVLAQAPPARLIVVDDGSRDDSAAIASAHAGVIVERRPPMGQAAALNHGLSLVRAPFVAFLDADDLMMPGGLGARLDALTRDETLDGVFGRVVQFLDPGVKPPARFDPGPSPATVGGTMLARAPIFTRHGGFHTDVGPAFFLDWMIRVRDAGARLGAIEAVVLERRVHDANLSRRAAELHASYLAALRRRFARGGGQNPP